MAGAIDTINAASPQRVIKIAGGHRSIRTLGALQIAAAAGRGPVGPMPGLDQTYPADPATAATDNAPSTRLAATANAARAAAIAAETAAREDADSGLATAINTQAGRITQEISDRQDADQDVQAAASQDATAKAAAAEAAAKAASDPVGTAANLATALVPYTGASSNLALGAHDLSAQSVTISGKAYTLNTPTATVAIEAGSLVKNGYQYVFNIYAVKTYDIGTIYSQVCEKTFNDGGKGIVTWGIMWGGSGFALGDIVTDSVKGASFTVSSVNAGSVTSLTLINAGGGYAVNDYPTLHCGSKQCAIQVLSVTASGTCSIHITIDPVIGADSYKMLITDSRLGYTKNKSIAIASNALDFYYDGVTVDTNIVCTPNSPVLIGGTISGKLSVTGDATITGNTNNFINNGCAGYVGGNWACAIKKTDNFYTDSGLLFSTPKYESGILTENGGDLVSIAINVDQINAAKEDRTNIGALFRLDIRTTQNYFNLLRRLIGGGFVTDLGVSRNGQVGLGVAIPTAVLHLKAGTATAGTAPIKLTSGVLNTVAVAGQIEYLTDDIYFTIATSAARKRLVLTDGNALTSGKIPIASTNGRLIDGVTPLAGTKTYYVSDTLNGAATRKLTFTNGILTSET